MKKYKVEVEVNYMIELEVEADNADEASDDAESAVAYMDGITPEDYDTKWFRVDASEPELVNDEE